MTHSIHKMVPVQVWADVDEGIAPLVKYLNTISGIRTHGSCQGTIGQGGQEPYGPYVTVSYHSEEAEMRVRREFDCEEVAQSTAIVRPREGWTAPVENCRECGGVPCRLETSPSETGQTSSSN
jgi:hypothetical protein